MAKVPPEEVSRSIYFSGGRITMPSRGRSIVIIVILLPENSGFFVEECGDFSGFFDISEHL